MQPRMYGRSTMPQGRLPLYRESPEEKEAREHFEFGQRWGAGAPAPFYAPESHRRDPFDAHFDPYLPMEEMRSETRPHWTDDDEGFSLDFAMQPRDIYR
jgi:hypothetical protein